MLTVLFSHCTQLRLYVGQGLVAASSDGVESLNTAEETTHGAKLGFAGALELYPTWLWKDAIFPNTAPRTRRLQSRVVHGTGPDRGPSGLHVHPKLISEPCPVRYRSMVLWNLPCTTRMPHVRHVNVILK